MTEKSSDARKRAPRAPRTSRAKTIQPDDRELAAERAIADSDAPPRPVMEEVFEELAAVRSDYSRNDFEGGDFETGLDSEAVAPRKPSRGRSASPRTSRSAKSASVSPAESSANPEDPVVSNRRTTRSRQTEERSEMQTPIDPRDDFDAGLDDLPREVPSNRTQDSSDSRGDASSSDDSPRSDRPARGGRGRSRSRNLVGRGTTSSETASQDPVDVVPSGSDYYSYGNDPDLTPSEDRQESQRERSDLGDERGPRSADAAGDEFSSEGDGSANSANSEAGYQGRGDYQGGDQSQRRRRRRGRGRGRGDGYENNGPNGGAGRQPGGRGPQQQHGRGRGPNDRFANDRRGPRPGQNRNQGYQPRERLPQGEGSAEQGNRPPETTVPVTGILELHPKGYGFLRDPKGGYVSTQADAFVSSTLIEKHTLRAGILIQGEMVPGYRSQGPRLKSIDYIDGRTPDDYAKIRVFDDLTAINPFEQIHLETGATPITMRVMDLLTPIGKGQRALLVAPPRSGKTMLLQEIANAVSENHPEVHLIVLLIDERPEEVTDMRRRVKGEVIASSMDREVEGHVRVSQLVFERAKRLAESGRDVFVLMDSITRTARAFNKATGGGRDSKIGTGGIDVRALDIPRKMFGSARRFEEGGSLTVVATALIDTGSKMDDFIFQEFKGTGNMEMVLSRDLADRRIWPAIDISKSGTRREEKILSPEVMEGVTLLRRSLVSLNPIEAMEQLTRILSKYRTNAEFLQKIKAML